jgi:hypothetical protein
MNRSEYLDEVCRLVNMAIKEAGKLEALNWLYEAEDLVEHPWLEDRDKCLQILEVSPNWRSYFLSLQNGCNSNTEDDGDDINELLENIACSAMFEDCNDILGRIVEADEQITEAKKTLDAIAHQIGNTENEIAAARAALENEVAEAEAEDAEEEEDPSAS